MAHVLTASLKVFFEEHENAWYPQLANPSSSFASRLIINLSMLLSQLLTRRDDV